MSEVEKGLKYSIYAFFGPSFPQSAGGNPRFQSPGCPIKVLGHDE